MRTLLIASPAFLVATSVNAATQTASFSDNFVNGHDESIWIKSGGYTNGSPFSVGWLQNHVVFTSDTSASRVMALRLDNVRSSGKRYSSGEYRTRNKIHYGTVSARMKPARGSGVVSSLFTYTGPAYGDPWDEINIEFLGKDTAKLHLNYFTDGIGNHETVIHLGFDASLAYHDYAFNWEPSSIRWYVDGKLVHVETGARGPLPTHPGLIFANLWTGDITVANWLGRFKYTKPFYAFYDKISYTMSTVVPVPP